MKEPHEITCPRCRSGPDVGCVDDWNHARPSGVYCNARPKEVEKRARRAERKVQGDRMD